MKMKFNAAISTARIARSAYEREVEDSLRRCRRGTRLDGLNILAVSLYRRESTKEIETYRVYGFARDAVADYLMEATERELDRYNENYFIVPGIGLLSLRFLIWGDPEALDGPRQLPILRKILAENIFPPEVGAYIGGILRGAVSPI